MMDWYKNRENFTREERLILSLLTLNEDPDKIWISYKDAILMSSLSDGEFIESLESLMGMGLIRMGDQGKGLSLALEEKIEHMMSNKLNEVLEEIEREIEKAKEDGDESLVNDLTLILKEKRNGSIK